MACHSVPFTVYPPALSKSEFFKVIRPQVRSREDPSVAQSPEGMLGSFQTKPTRLHPPTQEAADTHQE